MSCPLDIHNLSLRANEAVATSGSYSEHDSVLAAAFRNRRYSLGRAERELRPFQSGSIKILLLENINQTAVEILTQKGYQIETLPGSLGEDELIEKIKDVHCIGIRSKTRLTKRVLDSAKELLVIGCFCIGTNQVDLEHAAKLGVAVFNSPFSNSRSVAELVIGYIIMLARQLGDRSLELHSGAWNKVSKGCWEIRGKTLGIIGYGHIGTQLSVLAEAMGLHVIYYDVVNIMSLGTARQVPTLKALLENSDFVSLHVPELPETKGMISKVQFEQMRKGAYLINASRGTVVDIPALVEALESKKLAGAAIDVYPNEPACNGSDEFVDSLNVWTSRLVSLPNVVLSPHIGGSTNEAQEAIGIEVGAAVAKYVNEGSTVASVNFPEVDLRIPFVGEEGIVRILYIHRNVPGVLRRVNEICGEHNIQKQFSDSAGEIAYLMADIADVRESDLKQLFTELQNTPYNIRTRFLY